MLHICYSLFFTGYRLINHDPNLPLDKVESDPTSYYFSEPEVFDPTREMQSTQSLYAEQSFGTRIILFLKHKFQITYNFIEGFVTLHREFMEQLISSPPMASRGTWLTRGSDGDWILQERLRYRTKHREADLKFLQDFWKQSLPTTTVIHINSAPGDRKKWKKAEKTHAGIWRDKLFSIAVGKKGEVDEWIALIDSMREHVPLQKGTDTILTDVRDEVFRKLKIDDQLQSPASALTLLYFRALFSRALYYVKVSLKDEALQDIEKALTILPPVQDIPTPEEVALRFYRGLINRDKTDWEKALLDFRLCIVAGRQLMYRGLADMGNSNDILRMHCESLVSETLTAAVCVKLSGGGKRPLFTHDEMHDCFKELGVGPYTDQNYRCWHCKQSRSIVKLTPCANCQVCWFCSEKCNKAAWKEHKKICGSSSIVLSKTQHDSVRDEILRSRQPCTLSPDSDNDNPVVLCYDIKKDEIYDAFTNATIPRVGKDSAASSKVWVVALLFFLLGFSVNPNRDDTDNPFKDWYCQTYFARLEAPEPMKLEKQLSSTIPASSDARDLWPPEA